METEQQIIKASKRKDYLKKGAKISLTVLLLCLFKKAEAQNLLANGDFEDLNTCVENNARCSPAAWFIVLPTFFYKLTPKEGKHALVFYFDNLYTPLKRTFPYTKLLCPVKAGYRYKIQLWLNSGKHRFDHLDVLLTYSDPTRINARYGSFESTLQIGQADIVQKAKDGWVLLNKEFTPKEEYRFILIGNLSNNTQYAQLKKRTIESSGDMVYQIDNMSLTAMDSTLNSCRQYDSIRMQLYSEARRHTDYVYLDEEKAPKRKERSLVHNQLPVQVPVLKSDTLVLPGVLFKTNKSEIDMAYRALLDDVIIKIKDKDISVIDVNGYTDNTGTDAFNKTLSVNRAMTVGNYLTEQLPRLKGKIIETGYGQETPVAPNNSIANKARNRRVEIILHYQHLSQ